MPAYVLSRRAQLNLKAIHAFSIEQFGKRVANQYLRKLRDRMRQLTDNPGLGTARPDIKAGYRSVLEGSHIIYYTILDEELVGIIDVLHQAMDPLRQLDLP